MKRSTDWTELQQQWQSEGVPAEVKAEARRRVKRDHNRLRLELTLTGIAVLGVGAWSIRVLTTGAEAATMAVMLVFWTFAGILIGKGFLTLRGTWAPVDESTRSYLHLSLNRAMRRQDLSRFGLWLMAFWGIVSVGLLAWMAAGAVQSGHSLAPVVVRGALTLSLTLGVLGIWAERSRRRARRMEAELRDTLRRLDEDEV